MNHCINCKHFVANPQGLSARFGLCGKSTGNKTPNDYLDWLATGQVAKPNKLEYCTIMRLLACGEDGNLFEPKDAA